MTTEIDPTQSKLESTLGMRERDFYIDCLRSAMIALVVLHHTAITYGASGGWFYHELRSSATPSSVILSLFVTTNQAYMMGILFLLAGYFTPGSLERKGYARFLSDRFLRLGLPLLAFGLILGPLTVAMVTTAEGKGFWPSFVWLWNHGEFINGPLWFVQALLMFSLAYCVWRAWFGASLTSAQRTPRPVPRYGWWLLSAVGVGAAFSDAHFLARPIGASSPESFKRRNVTDPVRERGSSEPFCRFATTNIQIGVSVIDSRPPKRLDTFATFSRIPERVDHAQPHHIHANSQHHVSFSFTPRPADCPSRRRYRYPESSECRYSCDRRDDRRQRFEFDHDGGIQGRDGACASVDRSSP